MATAAAAALSLLLATGAGGGPEVSPWGYVVDGAGLAALVWAYVGLALGLGLGVIRPTWLPFSRKAVTTAHRQLDLAVLALVGVHGVATVFSTPAGSVVTSFVPQAAPVAPWAWTLGIVAFYLMVVLGPTWYLRGRIGRRTWLVAHQLAALTYALGLWHTLLLGAHVAVEGPVRTAVWLAQVPLLGLLVLRLARPARHRGRRHRALGWSALVGVVATAVVVLGVTLAAAGPGEHGTRVPGSSGQTR